MSNNFLSWWNWIDAPDAVLTVDAEAGELVGANLIERQGYKVWRTADLSDGNTDAGFTVDFGRARSTQLLMLVFPRDNDATIFDPVAEFAPTDTVRHRLSAVSAGAHEAYDSGVIQSGVLAGYGYHHVLLDAPVTARYWRVDLDAISRADLGYVDLVRAWAGPVFAPKIGFDYGDAYGWGSDGSVARASRGVAEFPDNVEPLRSWTFTLNGLSNDEKEELIEFERRCTDKLQFVAYRSDYTAGKDIVLARQQQSLGLSSLSHARNSKAFRLIESL